MKILSLNIWGGRAGKENLLAFFKEQSNSVDIFCLQEVWSAPYEHLEGVNAGGVPIQHESIMMYAMQEIAEVLHEYEYFFHPHFMDNYGLLMLVHKRIKVKGSGEVWVHKDKDFIPEGDIGHHARNIQYVILENETAEITVCNFHGLWNGKGKVDSEARLLQSNKIVSFTSQYQHVVLCGDFNLLLDTESVRKIEEGGFRNMIREHKVTSTRTSFYTKPEKFADYVFVSNGTSVKNFEVLTDEVSDHAPLLVEI